MTNGYCPLVRLQGLEVSVNLGAGVGPRTRETRMVAQPPDPLWVLSSSLAQCLLLKGSNTLLRLTYSGTQAVPEPGPPLHNERRLTYAHSFIPSFIQCLHCSVHYSYLLVMALHSDYPKVLRGWPQVCVHLCVSV